MPVPRPESLVQRTVKVVEDLLAEGRFGEVLPGEARLAEDLHVSRGTLRKALTILTERGVVSAGKPGQPRRVRARSNTAKRDERKYRVGVLALKPFDELATRSQQFFHYLAAETASDGVVYSHHHSVATQRQRPARWLKALLEEDPADLWLLYDVPIPVARFFRASGTPAVTCCGPALDEGLSYCGFDGVAALRHAIGKLVRAGHTRIILPSRHRRRIREQTFGEEFERRGMGFEAAVHMPLWNGDIGELDRLLCKRLDATDRPTAVLLNGLDALIVLYSCLMERRMVVPEDLSVIAIGSDPMLECFRPAIGHYETPYRPLARTTADLIRSHLEDPNSAPTIKLLQTEYVRGGSVGSAPA